MRLLASAAVATPVAAQGIVHEDRRRQVGHLRQRQEDSQPPEDGRDFLNSVRVVTTAHHINASPVCLRFNLVRGANRRVSTGLPMDWLFNRLIDR